MWTALPPIQLRNTGTAQVENLDHYLLRLAHVLGITHDKLLGICNAKAGKVLFSPHGASSLFLCNDAGLEARIEVVEALTGQTQALRQGTPWVCSTVLGIHGFTTASRTRRWCPVCYLQWDPETSIEPLAWSIDIKTTCSLHGCELVDRCQSCGRAQPGRTAYRARRTCWSCHAPLGWEPAPTATAQRPLDRWVDAQVDQVIELCANPAQRRLDADCFRQFLRAFVAANGDRADLPPALRAVVSLWPYESSSKISLRKLVNLAAMHGCDVIDMLLDPVRTAQREPLFGFWQGFDYLPLTPRGRIRGSVRLQVALRNLLRRQTVCYLPSLALVAKHAGCAPSEMAQIAHDVIATYRKARARVQRTYKSAALERAIPCALDTLEALGLVHVKRSHLCRIVPGLVAISGLAASDAWRVAETALILRRANRAREASQVAIPDAAREASWLQLQ